MLESLIRDQLFTFINEHNLLNSSYAYSAWGHRIPQDIVNKATVRMQLELDLLRRQK